MSGPEYLVLDRLYEELALAAQSLGRQQPVGRNMKGGLWQIWNEGSGPTVPTSGTSGQKGGEIGWLAEEGRGGLLSVG